jgi:hypothetical protein
MGGPSFDATLSIGNPKSSQTPYVFAASPDSWS